MLKSKILKDTYLALNKEMLDEEKKHRGYKWEYDCLVFQYKKGMGDGVNQARTTLLNMMQQMYTQELKEEKDEE